MTLTAIPKISYPTVLPNSTSTTCTIDAAADRCAWVFPLPAGGSINKAAFRTGTVSTAAGLTVQMFNIDSSGNPNESSVYGSCSGATVSSGSVTSNTVIEVTFSTPATATIGDIVALVIYPTNSDPINLQIQTHGSGALNNLGFTVTNTSGSYVKSNYAPFCGIAYSSVYTQIDHVGFYNTLSNTAFNSSSGPDEYALRFSVPFPATCAGGWWKGGATAGSSWTLTLYEGTTQRAVTQAYDGDAYGGTSGSAFYGYFTSSYNLAAGTTYYLALTPQNTTNVTLSRFTSFANNALLGNLPGGTSLYEGTRTDAGSWTDTTTNRPAIGLILSQLDDGTAVGAGGGLPVIGGSVVR